MKKGFTLIEVLTTLSIVGLIAMLTLPSFLKNYNNKIYTATLKKAYAQVKDGLEQFMAEEGVNSGNLRQSSFFVESSCEDGNEKGACSFLKSYFKYGNLCTTNDTMCLASRYTTIEGKEAGRGLRKATFPCIATKNGYTLCIDTDDINEYKFIIDVNGPADPNIVGVDLFGFTLNSNPPSLSDTGVVEKCGEQVGELGYVYDYTIGCFNRVLENGWVIPD